MPDLSELRPTYNEAGLLEAVDTRIRGAAAANGDPVWTAFVTGIAYDEKGRRTKIEYGNGTFTEYFYDALSFRLTRLRTMRAADGAKLQDLFYFYDPVGNITTIRDDAQQTVFFAGQQVTPTQEFEYDALYRLISATGREHAGGVGDVQRDQNDLPLWSLPHPNDAQALREYTETYAYDGVGNLLEMFHDAGSGSPGTWRRRYAYGQNPFGPGAPAVPANNRLHSTSLPGDAEAGSYTAGYTHDANGNMVAIPHLSEMLYTHADQMKRADLGGGGTAYYTYDVAGERVRKVIQRLGTTREERIYLGGWELYRKRQGAQGEIVLERETLHVMDDARRIAMVETKTVDADVQGVLAIVPRVRYQYGNHLDSAHLECDEAGLVISYEEYHPYGTPAYRSARSGVEVSEKRYRYTGKERDEETGFQYHSARYLAPWLGRWTSADPLGMVDGKDLYSYCGCAPVTFLDPHGRQIEFPLNPVALLPAAAILLVAWVVWANRGAVYDAVHDRRRPTTPSPTVAPPVEDRPAPRPSVPPIGPAPSPTVVSPPPVELPAPTPTSIPVPKPVSVPKPVTLPKPVTVPKPVNVDKPQPPKPTNPPKSTSDPKAPPEPKFGPDPDNRPPTQPGPEDEPRDDEPKRRLVVGAGILNRMKNEERPNDVTFDFMERNKPDIRGNFNNLSAGNLLRLQKRGAPFDEILFERTGITPRNDVGPMGLSGRAFENAYEHLASNGVLDVVTSTEMQEYAIRHMQAVGFNRIEVIAPAGPEGKDVRVKGYK